MNSLRTELLEGLRSSGASDPQRIARAIGGLEVSQGAWRFYSDTFPTGGYDAWNAAGSPWRDSWGAAGLWAFGEDVFGNQLVLKPGYETPLLWRHENGEVTDLELELVPLLETALSDGLDWLDTYADGSLEVFRESGLEPSETEHLHWTTPLILGGSVSVANLTRIERGPHLIGHAELWAQIGHLPPGTVIVPRGPR